MMTIRGNYASFPNEILYSVFENLMQDTLLACVLTCRTWSAVAEQGLYTGSIRLCTGAGLENFIQSVQAKKFCSRIDDLHIRGKRTYSSTASTDWILQVPHRLSALLPHVRSISFELLESVEFPEAFWQELEGFRKVTELRLVTCQFANQNDARNMCFAFPNLTLLSLLFVSWVVGHGWAGLPAILSKRWDRILPLRSVTLGYVKDHPEDFSVMWWLGQSTNIRELALLHIAPRNLDATRRYLKSLVGSLEVLTFRPVITGGDVWLNAYVFYLTDPEDFPQLIRTHTLHLEVIDLENECMAWVPRLLESMRNAPLRHITIDFTLDIESAARMSESWRLTNELLSTQWVQTLESVKLIHHPVMYFVSDSKAVSVLTSRLPALVERGVLEVVIAERYHDNI